MPAINQIETLLIFYIGIFVLITVTLILYIFFRNKKADKVGRDLKSALDRLEQSKKQLQFLSAEKNLPQSRDEFLFHLPYPVAMFNPKGYAISFNSQAQKLCRVSNENVVQKHFSEIFLPAPELNREKTGEKQIFPSADNFPEILEKKLLFRPVFYRLQLNKDDLYVNGILIPNPETNPDCLLFFFRESGNEMAEINDRQIKEGKYLQEIDGFRQKVKKLSSAREFATMAAEATDFAVVIISKDKKISYLNPQAEEMLGISQDKLPDETYDKILIFSDSHKTPVRPKSIDSAFAGIGGNLDRFIFIKTKFDTVAVNGSVMPVFSRSENQAVSNIVMVLRNANEDYERETRELAFFSGAAHDLRTPLSSIRGFIELLQGSIDSMPKEKIKDFLSQANESVLNMVNMVNQLLNVSRIDMGRLQINKEKFDIMEITESVCDQMMLSARQKKIYLKYEKGTVSHPSIYADKEKTAEILTNLISNAIKYTHQGGITITQKEHDSNIVTLVSDTGIGISSQNQKILFNKFAQVGGAKRTSISKSAGLGLYISQKFAQAMGGKLILSSSEPEKGSVFELTLPKA